MSLISLNVPESSMRDVLSLLSRIAVALERLAGPALNYSPPSISTLSDLSNLSEDELARVQEAQEGFALNNSLVPGSPAYLRAIEEFERVVADAYGEEAVLKLPWRAQ